MNDQDLVQRFDALGPLPGVRDHPPGLTRLLALRVHALCREQRVVSLHSIPDRPRCWLMASDLGSVLLAYLQQEHIDVELHQAVPPREVLPSCLGLVPLEPIGRLLPVALARFLPPLQINCLTGGLKMPVGLALWAMAAELDRVGAKENTIRETIALARPLDPAWRLAYPELATRYPTTPPPPPPAKPALLKRRKTRRLGAQVWKLADDALILDRLQALEKLKDSKASTVSALERLALTCVRTLPRATLRQAKAVEQLAQRFPNFAPACEWIVDQIRLHTLFRQPLHLPPVLLLGPPGIGKTMFCMELAQAVGAQACVRSFAELTASFLITGGSTKWANGGPGAIAQHLSECPVDRVPWFVFDEVDKAAGDRSYPLGPALLGLLEPITAQRFRDEALEIEMDVRPAGFIFTANELARVRLELVSRLKVIEVRAPTSFEMPAVVASVDAQLRKEQPKFRKLFAPIDAQVLLQLEAIEPRELRKVLITAYANAARRAPDARGQRRLLAQDLPSIAVRAIEPSVMVMH